MNNDFKPLCIAFVKGTEYGLICSNQEKVIKLEMSPKNAQLAIDFLFYCNGNLSVLEILKKVNSKYTQVR
jgi:hypothetical protein